MRKLTLAAILLSCSAPAFADVSCATFFTRLDQSVPSTQTLSGARRSPHVLKWTRMQLRPVNDTGGRETLDVEVTRQYRAVAPNDAASGPTVVIGSTGPITMSGKFVKVLPKTIWLTLLSANSVRLQSSNDPTIRAIDPFCREDVMYIETTTTSTFVDWGGNPRTIQETDQSMLFSDQ